jgi:hypothetical protein
VVKVRIADETVVYKKELLAAGFTGKLGLAYKAAQVNNGGIFFNRNQTLVIIIAKQVYNALFKPSAGR